MLVKTIENVNGTKVEVLTTFEKGTYFVNVTSDVETDVKN